MRKRHLLGIGLLGTGFAWVAACGGGGTVPPAGDSGLVVLPDGGVVLPDGNVVPADMDATVNYPGLDVALPDGFTLPADAGVDSTVLVDSGCSPIGITCQGMSPELAIQCDGMGNLTSTNCTQQGKVCAPGFGCVACVPGVGSCNGNNATRCAQDGSGYVTEFCDPLMGLTCNSGVCLGSCSSGNLAQSYIGCDYWAVTMANDQLAQNQFPYAVSIANTMQQNASVNIQGPANYNTTINVGAGAVVTQALPWVSALSTSAATSKQNGAAYHIRSTQPITVYQFNARDYTLNSNFSYTNDASLLLPVNVLTASYTGFAWPTWRVPQSLGGTTQLPGTIAIVGTQASTTVKFTPPNGNPVQAGGGVAASGTSTITLNAGDVLQIASALNASSAGSYGSDMTGAAITADKPVEVFGGHDCSFVPATVGYCDHLEEVIFPQETLRTDYLVVPPQNQLGQPRVYAKIVATVANTTLTYNPANLGPASIANAGQAVTFLANQPFQVTANANHPILISLAMLGQDNFQANNPNAGDPAMSAAVAIEQYRKDYRFFAPPNYAQNWVTVTGALNASVTVDNVNIGALTQIGNSAFGYKHVALCANNSCNGVHSASSSSPFGIQVYGYGTYTSYMYPGGLDLKR